MWFGETPSSSIVCNGHLAALLMPISAYAGQAMAQWPPAPQAIMFGFTQWKGLIGSAHVPDWTCFTPVGLHRIKGSPSPPGTIIRTHKTHIPYGHTLHTDAGCTFNALMSVWRTHTFISTTRGEISDTHPKNTFIQHWSVLDSHRMQMTFWVILTNITRGQCCLTKSRVSKSCHSTSLSVINERGERTAQGHSWPAWLIILFAISNVSSNDDHGFYVPSVSCIKLISFSHT